jgi:serine/threonine protein phosphatase PrpC
MITCPNCQSANRAGAKFCKSCAAPLPVSSVVTLKLNDMAPNPAKKENSSGTAPNPGSTVRNRQTSRTDTRPLKVDQVYKRRPTGAIFGDSFLYENTNVNNEQQNQYQVKQLDVAPERLIRVCPNPDCGAFFPPRAATPEKYCTDCGTVLEIYLDELALIEQQAPLADNLVRVVAKGLSHGSVRAPLFAFTEYLAGLPRHCMVLPQAAPMDSKPDTLQALQWGVNLGRGLDYLHDNGITYNGRLDNSCFGRVNGKAVWAGFHGCVHHPEGYVSDRRADVRALAGLIFFWLTGRKQFELDPNLTPGINKVFEQVMGTTGPATGWDLAQIFDQASREVAAPRVVDFQLGRRTNVGMVRSLNEDSILTLEINRNQQSYSQPLGVYVVADGMGGHAAGEIASGTIINVIAQRALLDLLPGRITQTEKQKPQEWLRESVEMANREVLSLRKSAGTDMGSTLVAVVLDSSRVHIAHVGDSRAYLINAKGIERLTTDHSLVERLIATNQITREEARYHPQRNVIYRTIGDKAKIEVDISTHDLALDDCILLCSDGLSGMIDDAHIYNIVMQAVSPQAACDALIEAANAAGGEDNVSAIVIKVVQV